MPEPKINIVYGKPKPKVHYTDVIDPEHWKRNVIPALLKAIEEVETIKFEQKKGIS